MESDEKLLVPMNTYLKSGIHIGTKFKSRHMDNFIYKARPDGLFVLNLQKIDEYLANAARFISKYEPQDIIVVCRRENGWKPVKLFGKVTGMKVYPGRYPPGIITNPALENFMEIKLLIVAAAWPDRNAVLDATKMGVPVVGLCDT
ncbi:MAG TPA: 30S ribosomal protein S2, partial [Candidatus Nanoarchaeia archaeon]|nr:30S ribosomal protein S2 [Candidatus Nanoarchaeia archaeon]